MINSVKPNLIVSDSRGAWFRATILFILALIGTVGMWSVVVFIPDIEKEFGLDRGTSSLLYAYYDWFWFWYCRNWQSLR